MIKAERKDCVQAREHQLPAPAEKINHGSLECRASPDPQDGRGVEDGTFEIDVSTVVKKTRVR